MKYDRERAILLKIEGKTYSEIGSILGIARQRAQVLVKPRLGICVLVRRRANGACEDCGLAESGTHHHIHHKTYSTSPSEFNHPDNLQYLCKVCHLHKHAKPKPPKPQKLPCSHGQMMRSKCNGCIRNRHVRWLAKKGMTLPQYQHQWYIKNRASKLS